jgi:hypothetical protein
MKRNLLTKLSLSACLFIGATGCLPEPAVEEPIAEEASARPALLKALETQSVSLIEAFNVVIADSSFIKNMDSENPPKPIDIENEEEIKKAVSYLLANETKNADATIYYPDKRICAEIIAKENPAACEKVVEKVSLAQIEQDATSGYVQFHFAGTNPFNFVYTPELVSISTNFSQLVSAAEQLDIIRVAHGDPSFAANLPTVRDGAATLTIAKSMGAAIIDITASQNVKLVGSTDKGQDYNVEFPAQNNIVTIALYPLLSIGTVSVNIPAAQVQVKVFDNNEVLHPVAFSFPGASGIATLNNSMSMLELSAVKLNAPQFNVAVNGQPAISAQIPNQLDAQIKTYVGGHFSLKALADFQLNLSTQANSLFDSTGSVALTVQQNTELFQAKDAPNAQVLSGSITLIGTQDYTANMSAQAGMCVAGSDQEAFYLQVVNCQ